MAKIFVENFVFQPKRKTAAEWESENPILRDGEFGVVTDGSDGEWLKVGDGVTVWNSLPYKKGPKGDKGEDGYTPQKGVDYFTPEDIAGLNIPSVDQTYSSTSENAQSGKAVAQAVSIEENRANSTFANALKASKSGSAILIDDVSPVTHDMGVKVRGKNLFDISKIPSDTKLTNNGDGTLTIAANEYGHTVYKKVSELCPDLKVGDTICLNFTTESSTYFFYFQQPSDKKAWGRNNSITVTQNDLDSYFTIYGYRATDENYGNPCTISNIQIELGTSATDYTPYVPDLTAVKVKKQGKNLFDISSSRGFESTYTGLTNTINGNELTVTATANRSGNLLLGTFPKGTYTINLNVSKKVDLFIQYGESISTGLTRLDSKVFNSSHTFSISETRKLWLACPTFTKDNTYIFTDIQFELGTTATEYEPYITPNDYTPTADGTVEGVSSIYPNTTLNTDTDGVLIDCEYNRDINKAFAALEAAIATNNS